MFVQKKQILQKMNQCIAEADGGLYPPPSLGQLKALLIMDAIGRGIRRTSEVTIWELANHYYEEIKNG